jgi:trimeric autotransporter adhesin
MTASVLQETQNSTQSAGLTSAATLTLSSGSYLHVFAAVDNTFTESSISSSPSLTWTLLDTINDTSNGQRIYHWSSSVTSAGSCTVTVTWSSSSANFSAIWMREIGGSSGSDVHTGQRQATPGTGTDGVSSGLLGTLSAAPALISALSYSTISGGGGGAFTHGTNFTLGANGWTFGSAANNGTSEHQRVTATTSIAATETISQNIVTITLAAAFTESGGAANTTITPPVGSDSLAGIASTVTPGTVTPITPLTARRTKSGLVVCERKVFLPPWHRKAA